MAGYLDRNSILDGIKLQRSSLWQERSQETPALVIFLKCVGSRNVSSQWRLRGGLEMGRFGDSKLLCSIRGNRPRPGCLYAAQLLALTSLT